MSWSQSRQIRKLIAELEAVSVFDDSRRISRAIEELVSIGEPAVEPLLAMLEGSRGQIHAVDALGRLGDERAVDYLVQLLSPDCGSGLRPVVIEALGRLREPLFKSIQDGLSSRCSQPDFLASVTAFAELRHPQSIPLLIRVLNQLANLDADSCDAWERKQQDVQRLQGLILNFGDAAVPALLDVLRQQNDWNTDRTAIRLLISLGKLGQALKEIDDAPTMSRLLSSLGTLEAAELQSLRDSHWVDRMLERLQRDEIGPNDLPLYSCAEVLGKLEIERAIPLLVSLLNTTATRKLGISALRYFDWKPASVEERITFAIGTGNWNALTAVGQIAMERLLKEMVDDEPNRSSIAKVLAQLGYQPATAQQRVDFAIVCRDAKAAAQEGHCAIGPLLNYSATLWEESLTHGNPRYGELSAPDSGTARAIQEIVGIVEGLLRAAAHEITDQQLRVLRDYPNFVFSWSELVDFGDRLEREKDLVDCSRLRQAAGEEIQRRAATKSATNPVAASKPGKQSGKIAVACACGARYLVASDFAGKRAKCSKCKGVVIVPES